MSIPQAVTAPTGLHQYHLEFVLREPSQPAGTAGLGAALASLWQNAVTGRTNAGEGPSAQPAGGLTGLVVGFGPALWERLAPGRSPVGVRPAYPITGPDGTGVPATQRDVWVWLNGSHHGTVLEGALQVVDLMRPVADLAMEQACFLHQDSRTWEGFIDGTENPGPFEAPGVVFVPDGHPAAGATTAVVQRWLSHRTAAFDALPVPEQEQVFGRTKRDSVELDPLPPTSHVARTVLTEDGVELPVYRRNIPFGSAGERGYVFVGFAADQSRLTRMLERMYGADAPAGATPVVDALTAFARPVSSSSYVVPSMDALIEAGLAPAE
jgi:porphyrinogen peroxidase